MILLLKVQVAFELDQCLQTEQIKVWLSARSRFPRPSCLGHYLVLVGVRQGLGRLREVGQLYEEAQSVSLAEA